MNSLLLLDTEADHARACPTYPTCLLFEFRAVTSGTLQLCAPRIIRNAFFYSFYLHCKTLCRLGLTNNNAERGTLYSGVLTNLSGRRERSSVEC